MGRAASARHTASLAGRLANDEPAQRAAVLRIALGAFVAAVHDRAAALAGPGGALLFLGAVLDCCAPLKCGLADVGGERCG